jgi:glycosyltransferase involved in cell wall biosynthesis
MDKLKLTIAVAIYNIEKYLPKCLESLLSQTEKNGYEILLINDGSTDNSRKICEEFIKKGLKAKIIDKENGGIVSVRNLSIDLAKGENILFLDGDDYIENETIEVIFKELKDYDMLVFGFNWIKNNIKIKDERFETTEVSYRDNLSLLEHDIYMKKINTGIVNKVFKISIIKNKNIYFKNYKTSEDFIFLYDFLKVANKYKKINKALHNYIYREDSLSNVRDKEYYICYLRVLEYYIEIEENKNKTYYKYILEEYVYLVREIRKIDSILRNNEIKLLRENIEKELTLKKVFLNDQIKFKMKLRYLKLKGR